MTETSTDLLTLVEQTVEGMGFEFVDLEHLPRGLLRVTMDSPEGVGFGNCNVCVYDYNQGQLELLQVIDPISGLEVTL